MEGPLWHRVGAGDWSRAFVTCREGHFTAFECEDDDEPSIPLALVPMEAHPSSAQHRRHRRGSNGMELRGGAPTEFLLGSGGHDVDDAPTNFTFTVMQDDAHFLFAAETKPALLKWRKAVKAEASVSSEAGAEPPLAATVADDDAGASRAAPFAEPAGHDSPPQSLPPSQPPSLPQPPEQAASELSDVVDAPLPPPPAPSQTTRAPVSSQQLPNEDQPHPKIVVHCAGIEMHLTFRSQQDLDRVTVHEIKGSVCLQANAEPDAAGFARPDDMTLSLGDALLREHWTGADFGLRPGTHLRAGLLADAAAEGDRQAAEEPRALVELRVGAHVVPLHVRDAQTPAGAVDALLDRLGVGPEQRDGAEAAAFRQVCEALTRENAALRARAGELDKRLRAERERTPAEPRTREFFEAALEQAALRASAAEAEKHALADQLFELRLLNAERLAALEGV